MKKILLIAVILLAASLRLYKLGSNPPSLYWDEASLGYNAYSILKTAKDEYGKFLPLTNFAAFGDYKPPGYIYLTVPSIAVFGLSEFAVRLPSAIFGILTVYLSYLIAKKLFDNDNVAILTAFLLAISPWHLQFSRAAFEANLGLFFSSLGIYLFITFSLKKQNNLAKSYTLLAFSGLSFLAAMYTFTGQRLFVPFILLILVSYFRKQILSKIKVVLPIAFFCFFLFLPLLKFTTGTIEGRLRFDEVTIFKDLQPINDSIRFRQRDNFTWWADIIHNRRVFFTYEYLTHYFDAFNTSFLFIKGDVNPRLSIQDVGELYLFELPLILFGIYFLFSKKQPYRWLIIGWLLVSSLGPATARETPHALRMVHTLPTFQLMAAFGLYNLYKLVKFKKLFVFVSAGAIGVSVFYYLHMYYVHWPRNYSGDWQYGYKQAVQIAKERYQNVDKIVVTKYLGRPYVYFLFYMKYDPQLYFKTANVAKDKFFFLNVDGFDKFIFVDDPRQISTAGKTLYITSPKGLPEDAQKITTIEDLSKKPVFDIGEIIR